MEIHVLVNNESLPGFEGEHGLSLLLTKGKERILLDCGHKDSLIHNAIKMNQKLNDLDKILLSHGHYDHSGNIAKLLESNPNAHFYAHPDCLKEKYCYHQDSRPDYIGLSSKNRLAIQNLPTSRRHWIKGWEFLDQDMWILTDIPRSSDFEDCGGAFFQDEACETKDIVPDDLILLYKKENRIWLISGCCHSGLVNAMDAVKAKWPEAKLEGLVGGFHLLHAKSERRSKTLQRLKVESPLYLYPGHCTGQNVVDEWIQALSNTNVIALQAGMKISL